MADVQYELNSLRDIIGRIIATLEVWTTLHDVCHKLGLCVEENTNNLGKDRYLHKVMAATKNCSILDAAKQILNAYPGNRGTPSATDLQRLQDALWWIESNGIQRISTVTRYRITESLDGVSFWGRLTLREFFTPVTLGTLGSLLPEIGKDGYLYQGGFSDFGFFFSPRSTSKAAQQPIQPTRISVRDYLQKLGFIEWPDERFCLLLQRLVDPEVQQADIQQKLVGQFNNLLRHDAYELRSEGLQGGLPLYKARRIGAGVAGVPKYIIFASTGPKPDIVIDDAVNMNIRVVRYSEQCLVYDQPPPSGDLTWQMLLEWWGVMKNTAPNDPSLRRDFGLRLRESLQSEPERILFDTYFKNFRPKLGTDLPALLPQVYLHYDPRNRSERGKPVLARQRMDFLMLLRNAVRIVIEIDGIQHYADNGGQAAPHRYAEMVAEDRRIRLLGYEVYRFGGAEFINIAEVSKTIVTFFEELFEHHDISKKTDRS